MVDPKALADQDATKQKYRGDIYELFRHAATEGKKSPLEVVKEFWRLSRGDGRLSFNDYFLFRLFEDARLTKADKENFISDRLHWPISQKCNDPGWLALTEDKWVSYKFMNACGIPTPVTVAVIDTGGREFGPTPKITNPSTLKQFLSGQTEFPLFAKTNSGMGSFGAFVITGIEGDFIMRDHAEPVSCDAIFAEVLGKHSYLLQRFLRNHRHLDSLTRYCATVRTINLMDRGYVSTPFALIKIPARTNIADNYWRKGNLIANLDPETGQIRRVITGKGIEMQELSLHPETNEPLLGTALPFWRELRALNETCARLYAPVRYNSLDIALTNDGPIVVEINTGGGFDLPQLASGEGFLTDQVRDFFAICGWKFKGKRVASS